MTARADFYKHMVEKALEPESEAVQWEQMGLFYEPWVVMLMKQNHQLKMAAGAKATAAMAEVIVEQALDTTAEVEQIRQLSMKSFAVCNDLDEPTEKATRISQNLIALQKYASEIQHLREKIAEKQDAMIKLKMVNASLCHGSAIEHAEPALEHAEPRLE